MNIYIYTYVYIYVVFKYSKIIELKIILFLFSRCSHLSIACCVFTFSAAYPFVVPVECWPRERSQQRLFRRSDQVAQSAKPKTLSLACRFLSFCFAEGSHPPIPGAATGSFYHCRGTPDRHVAHPPARKERTSFQKENVTRLPPLPAELCTLNWACQKKQASSSAFLDGVAR